MEVVWFLATIVVVMIWERLCSRDNNDDSREKLLVDAKKGSAISAPPEKGEAVKEDPMPRPAHAPSAPAAPTIPTSVGSPDLIWGVMQKHGRLVEVKHPDGDKVWVAEKHQEEALTAMVKAHRTSKRKATATRKGKAGAEQTIITTPTMEQWEVDEAEHAETTSP